MSVIDDAEKKRVRTFQVGFTVNVQMTAMLNELGEMVTYDIHQCAIGAGNSKQMPTNDAEKIFRQRFVEENAPTLIAYMTEALRQTIEKAGRAYLDAKEKGKHVFEGGKLIKG